MSSSSGVGPALLPADRIRSTGVLILAALAVILALDPPWLAGLRSAWFDVYQVLAPRSIESMPVAIVEIDEKSIAARGQWPWPRTIFADLIRKIAKAGPAAIGIDILMPEPDRLSPHRIIEQAAALDPGLAARIAALPSSDDELARAITAAPVVLALAGVDEPTGTVLRSSPIVVRASASSGKPVLTRFAGVIGNLDVIDRVAAGHGLISAASGDNTVRRIPLVFDIGGTLAPAFALDILRVAVGAPAIRMWTDGSGVTAIAVERWMVPTERDAAIRPYYSRRDARRYVSASDVLDGRLDDDRFRNYLVLVGVTSIGHVDMHITPLGAMPGTEIHAQVLETLLEGSWLWRPAWSRVLELAIFTMLGTLLIWTVPGWTPRNAALLALGCVVAPAIGGYVGFRTERWLLDAATPGLALLVLFGILLVLTLREVTQQRASLQRTVQIARESAARVAGEFEAARRIQIGMLPPADLLRDDRRVELAAVMLPARDVGGDLYDYFPLDARRLFFLIGDVAGKGLSASIFMAVSKALYKSMALRSQETDVGTLMTAANAEVSRDNPESLFVTAFAGILDLQTGKLSYCNAGHQRPYLLNADEHSVLPIADGGGPPLCAVAEFEYRSEEQWMHPREILCLITDGVPEACNARGEFYGSLRVAACLRRCVEQPGSALSILEALRADVAAHSGDAEPSDDLSVLTLRWNGP